jgi:hypothetical protein
MCGSGAGGRGVGRSKKEKGYLLLEGGVGEIQSLQGEVDQGIDLVPEPVRVREALEVDDQHLGKAPQVQLFVRLHHLLAALAGPALRVLQPLPLQKRLHGSNSEKSEGGAELGIFWPLPFQGRPHKIQHCEDSFMGRGEGAGHEKSASFLIGTPARSSDRSL